MGKITVKHYLNTNLKPYVIDGEKYYKVYVLIRANTQNTKIKSDISTGEFTEKEFKRSISDKNSEINEAIKIETELIEFIINKLNEDTNIFTSSLYTQYSKRFKTTIGDFINSHNKRHNPLFSTIKDSYISISIDYEAIIEKYLYRLKGLLAVNYEIGDLYLVQWFIGDIKEQIRKIYEEYVNSEDYEDYKITEKEISNNIQQLEKEIKLFLNLK